MRISKIAIIVSLTLAVLFAGFTVYGDKIGNLVFKIEKSEVSIAACLTENWDDAVTQFTVPGLENQRDATYTNIKEDIAEGVGVKSDEKYGKYMAFGFYLKNFSEVAVDYEMSLTVLDCFGDVLEVLRVEVIDGDGETAEREIFAKKELTEEGEKALKDHVSYTSTDFEDDITLFKRTVENFGAGEVKKYTVVFWLEGWDVACTEELYGSRLKMQMDIWASKHIEVEE